MENHDNSHHQRDDMYRAGGHLEDDCVCQFDIPGIAVRLDAYAVGD